MTVLYLSHRQLSITELPVISSGLCGRLPTDDRQPQIVVDNISGSTVNSAISQNRGKYLMYSGILGL